MREYDEDYNDENLNDFDNEDEFDRNDEYEDDINYRRF